MDSYIAYTINQHPPSARKPRKSRNAASILDALAACGLRLHSTQVRYTCARRNISAVLDGEARDAFGHAVAVEWKTGYSYRRSRQRRLQLPHLEGLYDNARNRALLQLCVGMVLSGAQHGCLIFANGLKKPEVLWLPKAMPQFFRPGAAEDIIAALSGAERLRV